MCVHKTLCFLVQTAFSHANWAVRAWANCAVWGIQCILQAQVGSGTGGRSGGPAAVLAACNWMAQSPWNATTPLKGRMDKLSEMNLFLNKLLVITDCPLQQLGLLGAQTYTSTQLSALTWPKRIGQTGCSRPFCHLGICISLEIASILNLGTWERECLKGTIYKGVGRD